ncbi:MAG TPA: cytosine permease, partial [Candidatus Dormibacteraeota bacterium]|nr:cytosine permease [Candidatus Dormibacteraeota bacterium]
TALGSVSHGVLSSFGPKFGVPQMVQGRAAFGFIGNILPSLLMSVTSGIGWFAVNSVSATFALVVLLHLPFLVALLIVVLLQVLVAFFGHNLVQVFERYAFFPLVIVFAISAVVVLTKSHLGVGFNAKAPVAFGGPVGAFILTAAAAFGYACGWNPYASDYTRYLPRTSSRLWTGIWAGLGIFVSCTVLEIVGAALVTVSGTRWGASDNPTQQLANALPYVLSVFTLLCITLGGIAANALNIYSGAMAFLTVGLRIGARQRRAIVAIVFGAIGFVLAAWGSGSAANNYNDFLLLIAYWIAPWLGVMFTEFLLRRGDFGNESIFYDRSHGGWQGVTAFVVATVLSIWLFANQTIYVGPIPFRAPQVGDLTFLVGFLLAAGLYAALTWRIRRHA